MMHDTMNTSLRARTIAPSSQPVQEVGRTTTLNMTWKGTWLMYHEMMTSLRFMVKQARNCMQLNKGIIIDPDVLTEYELERMTSARQILHSLQPFWVLAVWLPATFGWLFGLFCLPAFLSRLLPSTVTTCLLWLSKERSEAKSDYAFRCSSIALQIWIVFANSILRTVSAKLFASPIEDRAFYLVIVGIAYYVACMSFIPDREFWMIICPIFGSSWIAYHINTLTLSVPSFVSACAVGFLMVVMLIIARFRTEELHRHSFLLSRELKQVCSELEEAMSAQKSILSTLFDASCICSMAGEITQATPQMSELLALNEEVLVRTNVVSLLPPQEQKRVGDFLNSTWQSGVAKTAMIQTHLCRGAASALASETNASDSNIFEARIYCVRLAGASKGTQSMQLWAHSGLFLGLQEVHFCGTTTSFADAAQDPEHRPEVKRAFGVPSADIDAHEIVFDAGSERFEVISCSTLFQCMGLSKIACDLLGDLIQGKTAEVVDQWVYDEGRNAMCGAKKSSTQVRSLILHVPTSQGVKLAARSAWLEFDDLEHIEAEIPVRLRLLGLSVVSSESTRVSGTSSHTLKVPASIQESHIHRQVQDNALESFDLDDAEGTVKFSTLSEGEDDVSVLLPDDSISQLPPAGSECNLNLPLPTKLLLPALGVSQ